MQYDTKGRHVIADLWGMEGGKLDDLGYLIKCLTEAAKISGATILGSIHHKFDPFGVTIVIMLSESHLSIHTYPEHSFASIDCYTCGNADPRKAIDYLIEELKPTHKQVQVIERGIKMKNNN